MDGWIVEKAIYWIYWIRLEALTSVQPIEMQISQLFCCFQDWCGVCSLKKICLNLLKGSRNPKLGLQPESGYGHGVGFPLGEVGEGILFCLSTCFALPTRQSEVTGLGLGIGRTWPNSHQVLATGYLPRTPGVDRRPVGFPFWEEWGFPSGVLLASRWTP